MEFDGKLGNVLGRCAEELPFPVAVACASYQKNAPHSSWQIWELVTRDLLGAILPYLSHLLLADLVATGRQPPSLFVTDHQYGAIPRSL